MLVKVKGEMCDLLDLLLELQKLCLPRAFEKKKKKVILVFQRNQKLSIFFLVCMSLLLRFGFDMPVNSCQTLIDGNQVEERQQFFLWFYV